MNIQKKKNHKKIIIVTIALLVLIGVAGALSIYLVTIKNDQANKTASTATSSPSNTINYDPPTSDQVTAGSDAKTSGGSDQPPTPTPSGSGKSTVGMSFTSPSDTSLAVDGSVYHVRSVISTVTDSGTCTLMATNGAAVARNYTADVQPLASSTTCKGFDIPVADLSQGSWTLTLHFENGSLSSTITKMVTVR